MQWGLKKVTLLSLFFISVHEQIASEVSEVNEEKSIEKQNEQNDQGERSKVVQMSVWAKKAGGKFKSQSTRTDATVKPVFVDNEKAVNFTTLNVPTLIKVTTKVPTEESVEVSSEEYSLEESLEKENKCSKDHFWHIRGLRCVPFDCSRGNNFRNFETGECLFTRFSSFSGRRYYGQYPYVYRTRWWKHRPRHLGRGR